MCRGYTISFADCKHVHRMMEQRCDNAARLQSPHCEILITKPESDQYRLGKCQDCLRRKLKASGAERSQDRGQVFARVDAASGSPSRTTRQRPIGSKGKEREVRKATGPVERSGAAGHGQPSDWGSQNLSEHNQVDAGLTNKPEAFYRSARRLHRMTRIQESLESDHLCEDDESCCSEDEGQTSCVEPTTAIRETVDFSRWVRSPSVIDAATRRS
nr:hypothetical protein CFP56_25857 [Quercus suber]